MKLEMACFLACFLLASIGGILVLCSRDLKKRGFVGPLYRRHMRIYAARGIVSILVVMGVFLSNFRGWNKEWHLITLVVLAAVVLGGGPRVSDWHRKMLDDDARSLGNTQDNR